MTERSRGRRVGCVLVGCGAPLALGGVLCAGLVALPAGVRFAADSRETGSRTELAPAEGRFVEAGELSLYVQEHGPAEGEPVVLIHGTGAWSGTWRDTRADLAEAGYRVIAVDLPPFGYSERPQEPTWSRPEQGARIVGLLDALELEQVVLVGHSFGGGPTLEAALREPERVRTLVLVDAALSLDSAGSDPGLAGVVAGIPWARELAVSATYANPWLTRAAVVAMIHDPSDASPDRIALYQEPLAVQGTVEAVGSWLPELVSPDGSAWSLDPERIRAFDRPTALIWGREDTLTPPSQAVALDQLLPDSELHWLEGVGHIPQIEDPEAFDAALLEVLGRR